MRIVLPKCPDRLLDYLIDVIRELVLRRVDYKKLIKIEEYINGFIIKSKRHYTMRDMLTIILYNLTYEQYSDYSVIKIDQNELLYGTKIKLLDIVKFITYGTFDIRGNKLILQAMEDVKQDIEIYQRLYEDGGI